MAIVNSYVSLPEGMEVTTIVTPWLYNPHMTLGQASCNSQSRPIWRCPGSPEPRFRASSPGTWWSAHEGTPKLKWCSHHKTSLQDICSNIWNIPCVSRCYIWNIPTFLWECKFVSRMTHANRWLLRAYARRILQKSETRTPPKKQQDYLPSHGMGPPSYKLVYSPI